METLTIWMIGHHYRHAVETSEIYNDHTDACRDANARGLDVYEVYAQIIGFAPVAATAYVGA